MLKRIKDLSRSQVRAMDALIEHGVVPLPPREVKKQMRALVREYAVDLPWMYRVASNWPNLMDFAIWIAGAAVVVGLFLGVLSGLLLLLSLALFYAQADTTSVLGVGIDFFVVCATSYSLVLVYRRLLEFERGVEEKRIQWKDVGIDTPSSFAFIPPNIRAQARQVYDALDSRSVEGRYIGRVTFECLGDAFYMTVIEFGGMWTAVKYHRVLFGRSKSTRAY